MHKLNNVDIVFTSDKSKWSRCIVVETANYNYYDDIWGLGLQTQGEVESFDLRSAPSVTKHDKDGDGLPRY